MSFKNKKGDTVKMLVLNSLSKIGENVVWDLFYDCCIRENASQIDNRKV